MGKNFLLVLSLVGFAACDHFKRTPGVVGSLDVAKPDGVGVACDHLPKQYPAALETLTLKDLIEFRPRVTLHADGSSTKSERPLRTRDFDRIVFIAAPAFNEPVGSVEIFNSRSCMRLSVRSQKAVSDAISPTRPSEVDQAGLFVLRLNDNPLELESRGALLVRPGPNVLTITYYGATRSTVLGHKDVLVHVEIESVISDQEQVVTETP